MESEKYQYGRLSAGVEANVAKLKEHKMGNILSSGSGERSLRVQELLDSSDDDYYDSKTEAPKPIPGMWSLS